MTDTLRAAFEAWGKTRSFDMSRTPDVWSKPVYSPFIEAMWEGWQAGAQAERDKIAPIRHSAMAELDSAVGELRARGTP
jgi:hypothetical protein